MEKEYIQIVYKIENINVLSVLANIKQFKCQFSTDTVQMYDKLLYLIILKILRHSLMYAKHITMYITYMYVRLIQIAVS